MDNEKNIRARYFLCCDGMFPHGEATSNYVEYLGRAIASQDKDVEIVSRCDKGISIYNKERAKYKEIFFSLVKYTASGFGFAKHLARKNIGPNDKVILYTIKLRTLLPVYLICKFKRTPIIVCVVEWFRREQYGNTLKEYMRYIEYQITFRWGFRICKNILPISTYLNEYFERNGCNTFIVPPLMENNNSKVDKSDKPVKHFIYAGQGVGKDRVDEVISGFAMLDNKSLAHVQLHLCGMKRENINRYMHSRMDDLRRIRHIIVFHDWLEYGDYCKLLSTIDFLVISRETNKTTLANFPSKIPEMMGYGIIPIVSNVGDYAKLYLKDGDNSIIINGSSSSECYKAILRALSLSDDCIYKLKNNAKLSANKNFNYLNRGAEIVNFLESV